MACKTARIALRNGPFRDAIRPDSEMGLGVVVISIELMLA